MPGTPDPVLGSDTANVAVSALVAGLFVALPYLLRDRLDDRRAFALGGGFAYAITCFSAWAGSRIATEAFVAGMTADAGTFLGWSVAALVVFGVQAAIPYYCLARWRLTAPLAALFAVTMLILPALLSVRGESDPLGLYVLVFGPVLVGLTCLGGVAEYAVRNVAFGEN